MISLIIPTTSKNKHYTSHLVSQIETLYPDRSYVEVVVEENDNVSLGENYNNAVAKATGEKIILLHNDMYLGKNFVESMDSLISSKRIVTYTRVEPPVFMDTYPGKVIVDCGSNLETFSKSNFESINIVGTLVPGGSQLFFGCMKSDYIGLDSKTYKMFCEDDDIHLRYRLLGFESVVTSQAYVYHFVSKTSRKQTNYQQIELESNRAFVRKWGFRHTLYGKVYKKTVTFDPSVSYSDDIYTYFKDFCPYSREEANIHITVKGPVTDYDLENLQRINDMVFETGELGMFVVGNLFIDVRSLESFETGMLYVNYI